MHCFSVPQGNYVQCHLWLTGLPSQLLSDGETGGLGGAQIMPIGQNTNLPKLRTTHVLPTSPNYWLPNHPSRGLSARSPWALSGVSGGSPWGLRGVSVGSPRGLRVAFVGSPWGLRGSPGVSVGSPRRPLGVSATPLPLQNHMFYEVSQGSPGVSTLAGRAHTESQKRTSCLFLKLKKWF